MSRLRWWEPAYCQTDTQGMCSASRAETSQSEGGSCPALKKRAVLSVLGTVRDPRVSITTRPAQITQRLICWCALCRQRLSRPKYWPDGLFSLPPWKGSTFHLRWRCRISTTKRPNHQTIRTHDTCTIQHQWLRIHKEEFSILLSRSRVFQPWFEPKISKVTS